MGVEGDRGQEPKAPIGSSIRYYPDDWPRNARAERQCKPMYVSYFAKFVPIYWRELTIPTFLLSIRHYGSRSVSRADNGCSPQRAARRRPGPAQAGPAAYGQGAG